MSQCLNNCVLAVSGLCPSHLEPYQEYLLCTLGPMQSFRGGCKTREIGNSNAGHGPMKLKWKLMLTDARSK